MIANRSVPSCSIIPELAYEDVRQAVDWLCEVFGFKERLRIGDHRSQLVLGNGAVIIVKRNNEAKGSASGAHSVLVRVEDVDRHYELARERRAKILQPPEDYPYGERQYVAEDLGGHRWTFSQSLADVDPSEWGGVLSELG